MKRTHIDSISVVNLDTPRRTPLHLYLNGLASGVYLSPGSGTWRDHDEEFHNDRVESLSPDDVELAVLSATVGSAICRFGLWELAEGVGKRLDIFLTRFGSESTSPEFLAEVADTRLVGSIVPIDTQHDLYSSYQEMRAQEQGIATVRIA